MSCATRIAAEHAAYLINLGETPARAVRAACEALAAAKGISDPARVKNMAPNVRKYVARIAAPTVLCRFSGASWLPAAPVRLPLVASVHDVALE
jgi:hypothetical protein